MIRWLRPGSFRKKSLSLKKACPRPLKKACPRPVVPEEAARRHRYLRPLGRSVAVSGDYRGVDHPPAQRAFAVFRAEGCGSGRGKRCGRCGLDASGSLVICVVIGVGFLWVFAFVRYDAGHFRPDES